MATVRVTEPLASSDAVPSPHSSFDELVRDHYARLCNFAFRFVGSRDVAEDVVQDVFAHLWRQWNGFDLRDPLPYLYRAVRNRLVTERRQDLVRERWRAGAVFERRHADDAAAGVELGELRRAVACAVDALPERCRLIFTMSREQDLSYGEIARILDISVKTVETQMGRALRSLRVRLAPFLSIAGISAAHFLAHRLIQ